jgi:hypothetical protein
MTNLKAQRLIQGNQLNKTTRRVANNTYATINDDKSVSIRLHQTDIVTIHVNDSVEINSGGWMTSTTKSRINEFTNAGIYQKNFEWFLSDGTPFVDGMTIDN